MRRSTTTAYSPEIRKSAVALARKRGFGYAAKKLSISEASIRNWTKSLENAEAAVAEVTRGESMAQAEPAVPALMSDDEIKKAIKWAFWGYQQAQQNGHK